MPLIDYVLNHSFVGDGAVLSILVEISTPSFALSTRIVEAHEPVRRLESFLKGLDGVDKFLRADNSTSASAEI